MATTTDDALRTPAPDKETVARALATAREMLGMHVAFVAAGGERQGASAPGELEVPVVLSDGRVHGTLRCVADDGCDLDERDVRFLRVLAKLVADHVEREELDWLANKLAVEASSLQALQAAVEARDSYTGEHCQTVVDLSTAVARELGLDDLDVLEIARVALLHDIGKIGVPDSVLQKQGPLSDDEWQVMREHTEIGHRILSSIAILSHLAPAVRAEHERWDGSGYPDGLAGEEIPLASRITLVCDAYHAMTSDRPYRRSLGVYRALMELDRQAGRQFDPEVVAALRTVLQRK